MREYTPQPSYLNELLARILAVAQAAVLPVTAADGSTNFLTFFDDFPYFTMRVADDDVDTNAPMDVSGRSYTIVLRLVIGHLLERYEGENEELLYMLIPLVEDAFESDHWLLNDETELAIPEMSPSGMSFIRSRGLVIFQSTGIGKQQVGTEFVFHAAFDKLLDRRY